MMLRSVRPTVLLPLILALALVFSACEGPVGPPGPPGRDGLPGDPAVTSFDVFFDSGAATLSSDELVLFTEYDAPEINRGVVENGIVMAYYFEETSETWTAMPYTYGEESQELNAVDYTLTFGYAFNTGFLQVFYEASAPFALDFAVSRDVRVVVLEGDPFAASTAALSKSGAPVLERLEAVYPEVDWQDYRDVAKRFDLSTASPTRTLK